MQLPDEREPMRVISDDEFQRQLHLLRRTRRFLIAEGVPATANASGESPFSLGRLNLIRGPRPHHVFFTERGSSPTLEDWSLLEQKQDGLQRFFNSELQRRYSLQATREIITITPIFLLLIVFGALFLAVAAPDVIFTAAAWRFAAYLAWTSSLGGLGAIGFLAVNSLAIQNDATFDMSNPGLVTMRIVLGALFGSIVSLPFCLPYFKEFTNWVLNGGDLDAGRGVFLLLPFLLGFSTTLVMAVLNRMVGGIETVFGIERSSAKGAARTADGPATSTVRPDPAAPDPLSEARMRRHPPAADG